MSHYSIGQKPHELFKWSKQMAKDIKEANLDYPVLVYRGMSGTSLATGLSLALYEIEVDHGMLYIRKPEEQSHGCSIESDSFVSSLKGNLIFVDDFISSGDTRDACLSLLKDRARLWKISGDEIGWSGYCLQTEGLVFFKQKLNDKAEAYSSDIRKWFVPDNSFMEFINKIKVDNSKNSGKIRNKKASNKKQAIKAKQPKVSIPFWANDWRKNKFSGMIV